MYKHYKYQILRRSCWSCRTVLYTLGSTDLTLRKDWFRLFDMGTSGSVQSAGLAVVRTQKITLQTMRRTAWEMNTRRHSERAPVRSIELTWDEERITVGGLIDYGPEWERWALRDRESLEYSPLRNENIDERRELHTEMGIIQLNLGVLFFNLLFHLIESTSVESEHCIG